MWKCPELFTYLPILIRVCVGGGSGVSPYFYYYSPGRPSSGNPLALIKEKFPNIFLEARTIALRAPNIFGMRLLSSLLVGGRGVWRIRSQDRFCTSTNSGPLFRSLGRRLCTFVLVWGPHTAVLGLTPGSI